MKFNLEMFLRYDTGSTGDIELLACIEVDYNTISALSLPVYCTLTVKGYGPENDTLSNGPNLHVYDMKKNFCWKALSSLYLENLTRKRCLTIEFYGIHNV